MRIVAAFLIIIVVLLAGCDAANPAVVKDNPAIKVQVVNPTPVTVSGTVSATVTNPLPVSVYGTTINEGGLPVTQYYYRIADGDVTGHIAWSKIGYNPALVAATEADVWSATGVYVFPTAAAGMEVLSSDNTQDIGTQIKTATCDAGGTTTTLNDADVDFTAATAVAVGDCVIIDKSGTTPEWGYVTTVAAHTLTFSDGLSSGGSCATARAYTVVDKSAYTGAQAVKVEYLNGSYVGGKSEIIVLNGTTVVPTVNLDLFRVNLFCIIASGTDNKPKGNLTIRNLADTPVYSYITAGYTRARNIMYTVPADYTLFVTSASVGYAYEHNSTHSCRIYTKANRERSTGFSTGNIFYPYSEFIVSNSEVVREFELPTKLRAKTDIKVSAIATYAGVANVALRGWLESN